MRARTCSMALAAALGCGSVSAGGGGDVAGARGEEASGEEGTAKPAGAVRELPAAAGMPDTTPVIEPEEARMLTDEVRATLQLEWNDRLIAPYGLSHPGAPAEPLIDGAFEGSPRFRIEQVPPGVTFHRVSEDPLTYEVRDAAGGRLALIQEEEWASIMAPNTVPELTVPLRTQASGETHRLDDWDGGPATVFAQQYVTPLRLYRIERLADGTDWILQGFTYVPPDAVPDPR